MDVEGKCIEGGWHEKGVCVGRGGLCPSILAWPWYGLVGRLARDWAFCVQKQEQQHQHHGQPACAISTSLWSDTRLRPPGLVEAPGTECMRPCVDVCILHATLHGALVLRVMDRGQAGSSTGVHVQVQRRAACICIGWDLGRAVRPAYRTR